MTLAETAEYLNCHYSTLYRLIRDRDLPAFRLGGSWRFLRSEIEQWIVGRTGGASAEKSRKSEPTTAIGQIDSEAASGSRGLKLMGRVCCLHVGEGVWRYRVRVQAAARVGFRVSLFSRSNVSAIRRIFFRR